MSAKPENQWIDSMHKHMPPLEFLHREGMHNALRGGTPDVYYSGFKADLWVEYKFLVVPKRGTTMIDLLHCTLKTEPMLSGLQQDWISSRYAEGRNVWVIVGHKDGGVIYRRPADWMQPMSTMKFKAATLSRKDVAAVIVSATCPPK